MDRGNLDRLRGRQVHLGTGQSQNQRPKHAGRRICTVYEISSRIRFGSSPPTIWSLDIDLIYFDLFVHSSAFDRPPVQNPGKTPSEMLDGDTARYGLVLWEMQLGSAGVEAHRHTLLKFMSCRPHLASSLADTM